MNRVRGLLRTRNLKNAEMGKCCYLHAMDDVILSYLTQFFKRKILLPLNLQFRELFLKGWFSFCVCHKMIQYIRMESVHFFYTLIMNYTLTCCFRLIEEIVWNCRYGVHKNTDVI